MRAERDRGLAGSYCVCKPYTGPVGSQCVLQGSVSILMLNVDGELHLVGLGWV